MLRLVKDGPEIPLEVLAAHEAGRLIFFCGAGISMDSGLPNFKGLVDYVYLELGELQKPSELVAYRQGRLDKVLSLLEERTVARRVRQIVIERLTRPSLVTLDLHQALLELSKVPDGGHRLVTTNFDDRFSEAGLKEDFIDGASEIFRAEARHLALTCSSPRADYKDRSGRSSSGTDYIRLWHRVSHGTLGKQVHHRVGS